jgi:oxaloacetate decarboxylase gamma subunit
MESGLFEQGLELMLYGMGTVVAFLTLLVFATGLMSTIITRFFPVAAEVDEPRAVTPAADTTLLAVISAAIHKHRSGR